MCLCVYIYIYIYSRGVTVHKIRYGRNGVTVRYIFETGGGGGAFGHVAMLKIFQF